jgi:hypothetical protein
MKTLLIAASVAAATLMTTGSAFANRDSCNGLSGYYGNVTSIIVGQDGKTVNIHLALKRPHGYGTCNPDGSFSVNFPDDPATKGGTFDGTTIRWDNGTTWTKAPE